MENIILVGMPSCGKSTVGVILAKTMNKGFVDTDMTKNLSIDKEEIEKAIPLGRLGKAEDIANAVAFLVEADYITGEVLRVDGGIAM